MCMWQADKIIELRARIVEQQQTITRLQTENDAYKIERPGLAGRMRHLERNIERLEEGSKYPGQWIGLAGENKELKRKNGRLWKERAALCRLVGLDPNEAGPYATEDDPLYRAITRLQGALKQFGRHYFTCDNSGVAKDPLPCSCGLAAALNERKQT